MRITLIYLAVQVIILGLTVWNSWFRGLMQDIPSKQRRRPRTNLHRLHHSHLVCFIMPSCVADGTVINSGPCNFEPQTRLFMLGN